MYFEKFSIHMDELISVIIPTYKRSKKLLRAVNSVLIQSYKKLEILIVNDDSEDIILPEIISNINDERVILINNERTKGANGARNTGILNAKGKYIAFLDDDDELYIDGLETQLFRLNMTNSEIGFVYGGYLLEKGSNWVSHYYKKEGDLFSDLVTGEFSIGASSNIFVKKETIDKVGLWDESLMRQQDLEFLIRILEDHSAVFNNNLVVKIYGHNEPNPNKAFHEREKFLNKIYHHLFKLSDKNMKIFFSNHYRRQALFLIKMRDFKRAKIYWLKAFSYKKISVKSFRKDTKLALTFVNKLIRNVQ